MTRIKALSTKHLVFKINENDHAPPHVHIEGLGASSRVNLLSLEVMDSKTEFSVSSVNRILKMVRDNRAFLLQTWEDIHG